MIDFNDHDFNKKSLVAYLQLGCQLMLLENAINEAIRLLKIDCINSKSKSVNFCKKL